MIKAMGNEGMEPKTKDVRGLSSLNDCAMKQTKNDTEISGESLSIPSYIIAFFEHFLLKQETIRINVWLWTFHKGVYDETYDFYAYGYSKFASTFFILDDNDKCSSKLKLTNSIPKINIFIEIMPNLKRIKIFNEIGNVIKPSISLSNALFLELMKSVILVNSMQYSLFEYIQIVEPSTSIQSFIDQYGDKFKRYGWTASKARFEVVEWALSWENSLMIKRLV